jgi:LPS export ABC transporter protein LptC
MMSRRNNIILGMLFLIVMIEVLVLAPKQIGISSDTEQESAPALEPRDQSGSSQIMRDVRLVEAKGSEKEWELWAKAAFRPKDNEQWDIEKVKVTFFADNGVTYTVTGMRGQVITSKTKGNRSGMQTSDIRIFGDVETQSSNGYIFKSESIIYDSKGRRLTSPSKVEMVGPEGQSGDGSRLKLTGAEMVADFVTNEMTVNRDVKARKVLTDNQMTASIRSQRALFSGRGKLAQFFGDVIIEIDSMRLTGPEAKFVFDPTTDSFDSVEVTGGVKVTDADKFATSGHVSVYFKEDRVVFNGAPRVVQNGDELTGDEIVFLDGGRKVQVNNAKAQIDPDSVEKRN